MELDTTAQSPQLHQDGLRINKGKFGIDKSGKRKNEGFSGDEGARDAKTLNAREFILLDIHNLDESATGVTLDVITKRAPTLSGVLVGLERTATETYKITETVPLQSLADGQHRVPLTSTYDVIGLYISGSTSAQVGLEVLLQ
jgi:hypothetical protein